MCMCVHGGEVVPVRAAALGKVATHAALDFTVSPRSIVKHRSPYSREAPPSRRHHNPARNPDAAFILYPMTKTCFLRRTSPRAHILRIFGSK